MNNLLDTIKKTIETIANSIYDTTIKTIITYDLSLSSTSTSQIVLEYLKVIIWPLLILICIFLFHKHIRQLFTRIINESEEINSSFLGLNAKFRKQISELNISKNEDSANLKTSINEILKSNFLDEFKLLSSYFFTKSTQVRKQTAIEISKISENLQLDDVLNFASSALPGERVAAFIGIKTHIKLFSDIDKDERIIEAIRVGLDDGFSRVRFRVVEAISESNDLVTIFRQNLNELYLEENNSVVKDAIKRILK